MPDVVAHGYRMGLFEGRGGGGVGEEGVGTKSRSGRFAEHRILTEV